MTNAGGKIIRDGLILGYDADDRSSRFYLGEPTTNLVTNFDYYYRTYNIPYIADSWGGDAATVWYYPDGGYNNLPYKKMEKTSSGSGGSFLTDNYGYTLSSGVTYTLSCYMKASSIVSLDGHSYGINRDSDNYYKPGNYITLSTEWQRITWTFVINSGEEGIYQMRNIIYTDSNLPLTVYWCGYQVEQKLHATQFTPTSRDNTTSLIDLKRTKEIDLSNVSFDNTAHPVFDGTNDTIGFGIGSDVFPLRQFSVEMWFKSFGIKETSGTSPGLFGFTYGFRCFLTGTLNFGLHDGTSLTYTTVNKDYRDNIYHHIVCQNDGSTSYVYIDGMLKSTSSAKWPGSTIWPTDSFNIGRDNNNSHQYFYGYIPTFKLYNRVLSSNEVKKNYESTRWRFNI